MRNFRKWSYTAKGGLIGFLLPLIFFFLILLLSNIHKWIGLGNDFFVFRVVLSLFVSMLASIPTLGFLMLIIPIGLVANLLPDDLVALHLLLPPQNPTIAFFIDAEASLADAFLVSVFYFFVGAVIGYFLEKRRKRTHITVNQDSQLR